VARPTRPGGYVPADKQIILIQGDRRPAEDTANSRATYITPFAITLVLITNEKDETPSDTYINRFAADVEKVLLGATSEAAWAFDGRLDFTLSGPEPSPLPDIDGALMILEVTHRHDYGDPYTAS
jgi:hypothetical protein